MNIGATSILGAETKATETRATRCTGLMDQTRHRFVETSNLHGTGCTFSAAITARLALGEPLLEAVAHAKHYISRAIEHSLAIGHGHGPTHHFYFLEPGDCLER